MDPADAWYVRLDLRGCQLFHTRTDFYSQSTAERLPSWTYSPWRNTAVKLWSHPSHHSHIHKNAAGNCRQCRKHSGPAIAMCAAGYHTSDQIVLHSLSYFHRSNNHHCAAPQVAHHAADPSAPWMMIIPSTVRHGMKLTMRVNPSVAVLFVVHTHRCDFYTDQTQTNIKTSFQTYNIIAVYKIWIHHTENFQISGTSTQVCPKANGQLWNSWLW